MPDPQHPWYTVTDGAGFQGLKHTFAEEELTKALRMYGYVRRDLPGGYRIDLRRAEEGLRKHGLEYDGQIWKEDQALVQDGAGRAPSYWGSCGERRRRWTRRWSGEGRATNTPVE